jgi:potassium efflux system protein
MAEQNKTISRFLSGLWRHMGCNSWLLAAVILLGTGLVTEGQQVTRPAESPTTPLPPGAAPPPTPSVRPGEAAPPAGPIPFSEVHAQAKAIATTLRSIEAGLLSDSITDTIATGLPELMRECEPRLDENSKILLANPSLGILSRLADGWQQTTSELSAWDRQCVGRIKLLDSQRVRLTELESRWEATRSAASTANVPANIKADIENALAALRLTHKAVDSRREQVLALQSRIVEEKARIAEMITAIKHARVEVLDGLFVQNGPPIWSRWEGEQTQQSLAAEVRNSLGSQWDALRLYARRTAIGFCLHLLVIMLLGGALLAVRRRALELAGAEADLKRAAVIFDAPLATAVLLSVLLSRWIYPQAPRLLTVILGAVALIPTILILRRLIERSLYPVLNGLAAFYFMSQLRDVLAASPLLSRRLFLAEFLAGILFLGWLIRSERLSATPGAEQSRLRRMTWFGARVALAGSAAAFVANLVGYIDLGNYLGSAILNSVNLAAILYTLARVLDALFAFALRLWPLVLLDLVRRHQQALRRLVRNLLQAVGIVLWTLYTLEQLGLREPLATKTNEILNARLSIASFYFTPAHLFVFCVTVWASFLLSRFLRFLLAEDVYPRVHLAQGIPYALSTLLHYIILLTGFYIAIAALGFDMNRFTILAGAFGVGFGFGLQNVINNFVSGLILLFERPVKVGDVVQLEGAAQPTPPGVVERIGMRASVIRVADGSEVIVPNGNLISQRVTNWTYSNRRRSIDIAISVPSNTEPQRVLELLQRVAAENPHLIKDPPPEALFVKFGSGVLNFELNAWTDHYDQWQRIRSDLATAIHAALSQENILIS